LGGPFIVCAASTSRAALAFVSLVTRAISVSSALAMVSNPAARFLPLTFDRGSYSAAACVAVIGSVGSRIFSI
jgi:hypothetical protein